MSMTPFHIAAAWPFKKQFDFLGFVLVNVIIDAEVVLSVFYDGVWPDSGEVLPLHGDFHTLLGATLIALIVGALRRNLWGALIGAWSHIFIDMFYHADVFPLGPWIQSNPFSGIVPHGLIDLLLLVPVLWQGFQWCRTKLADKFRL